ncbi:type VII toxin-antitoxin system MntA family adenylyltransferase antitoxin [Aliagarivorans marinus]|uniref:type VII toxin-antitoxin system MntA family adenylyltransferase antitoxin n=1 Tax=Aliagarivorans marinus TaxID=561965 RepID=UPI0005532074|nr:nucleotidyltransferase domain-containing protein [Aliagarivorans marinus]
MKISYEDLVSLIRASFPQTRLIYLFGSQADGSATANSDIDLAILLPEKLDPIARFDLQESLAIAAGLDVDLVDLLSASTVMQHQIIYKGVVLWGEANDKLRFEMQVMSMYQHLNEERADILKSYHL